MNNSPPRMAVDIAILTVTEDEFDAVHRLLQSPRLYQGPPDGSPNLHAWTLGFIPWGREDQHYRVVLGMLRRQGNVSASQATADTFAIFQPRYIVLTGIAGGLDRDGIRRGSIAVSSDICFYEYGKINEGGYQARPAEAVHVANALVAGAMRHAKVNPLWHELIGQRPPDDVGEPNVVSGPIASGEKVVDYVDYPLFRAVVKKWPKLIAIEMEGAGAGAAINRIHEKGGHVGFLMIRGISDMPKSRLVTRGIGKAGAASAPGADQSLAERTGWTPYAAAAAAAFTVSFIQHSWPVVPRENDTAPRGAVTSPNCSLRVELLRSSDGPVAWHAIASRNGEKAFCRNFELAVDPTFDLTLTNTGESLVPVYRVGVQLLDRQPGVGGTCGEAKPAEMQADYCVQWPKEWKSSRGPVQEVAWFPLPKPMMLEAREGWFRFSLKLGDFCDTERASVSRISLVIATSEERVVSSAPFWLSE